MRSILYILICNIFTFFPTISNGEDRSPEKKNKLEEKVFDGLAELSVTRGRVLREFSYLATGEMTITSPPRKAGVFPFFMIRTESKSRKFRYNAMGNVMMAEFAGAPTDQQDWSEILIAGKRIMVREGPVRLGRRYTSPKDEEEIGDFLTRLRFRERYFDPFDDIISVGNTIWSSLKTRDVAAAFFVGECELVSVEPYLNGQVLSKWEVDDQFGRYSIELYQSKTVSYLPVKVRYLLDTESYRLDSTTRVEWKKKGENWLPVLVEATCPTNGSSTGTDRHWIFSIEWRVGKDVPASFYDIKQADLREASRVEFDARFSFIDDMGVPIVPPWETPSAIERAIEKRRAEFKSR